MVVYRQRPCQETIGGATSGSRLENMATNKTMARTHCARAGHAVNTSGKFFLPGLTAQAATGQYDAVHVGIFVEELRR